MPVLDVSKICYFSSHVFYDVGYVIAFQPPVLCKPHT